MNKIVDKECEQCGTMMHQVSSRKKYCPECTRLRNIDHQAQRRAQIRDGEYSPAVKLVDKECEQCGRMMHGVAQHKRFCMDCSMDRIRASNGRRYEKSNAKKRVQDKPKSRTKVTLNQAVRAAKAAGMSYGQWVLHNEPPKEDT